MTDVTERRPVGRPPLNREAPRDAAPPVAMSDAERARRRAEEIRSSQSYVLDPLNEFDIPLTDIPDGWSYQWVRESVVGKEDPDNITQRLATGWQAVPADRHRNLLPHGYLGKTIIRKGQILMERPAEITQEIRRRDQRIAEQVVADREEALGLTPAGTMPRDADPRTRPRITSERSPAEIPDA